MATDKNNSVKDPLIEAQIERALKPYIGRATPEMLATMREEMEEMLSTHPVAVGLLDQLREPTVVPQQSGDVPREGAEPDHKQSGGGKEGA